MRNLTMADDFRRFGLAVVEDAGWQSRGRAFPRTPIVSVNHHTACAFCGNSNPHRCPIYPSGPILINGRTGVPGPLANAGQRRDDVVHVIASGKSNNAGRGSWRGADSNYDTYGLEIEFSGLEGEAFPWVRFDTAARVQAAWAWRSGYGAESVCQHFEWAPTRKIDLLRSALAPWGGADGFREHVQGYIDNPPHLSGPGEPAIDYVLDRTYREGDSDSDTNKIVTRIESLLLWWAEKYRYTGSRPGKLDGKFTSATGDSVQAFRAWWWDIFEAHKPESERHIRGRDGRAVGRKVYDALVFAASAPADLTVPTWKPIRPGDTQDDIHRRGGRWDQIAEVKLLLTALADKFVDDELEPGGEIGDRTYDVETQQAISKFKSHVIGMQKLTGQTPWPNTDANIGPATIGALRWWNAI